MDPASPAGPKGPTSYSKLRTALAERRSQPGAKVRNLQSLYPGAPGGRECGRSPVPRRVRSIPQRGGYGAAPSGDAIRRYVAGIFRTVRFGTGEAHGRAEMMEFNYLAEQGAITHESDRYQLDVTKMPSAIEQLARELLDQEATGDRARAEAWFSRYDHMPPLLTAMLARARDVPIDIDPTFAFGEPVQ